MAEDLPLSVPALIHVGKFSCYTSARERATPAHSPKGDKVFGLPYSDWVARFLRYTASMRTLPYLSVPVPQSPQALLSEKTAMFELFEITAQEFRLDGVVFYECAACSNAACPSFTGMEIPQEVMDHLYQHAATCEAARKKIRSSADLHR
jgi:hypothetical protein